MRTVVNSGAWRKIYGQRSMIANAQEAFVKQRRCDAQASNKPKEISPTMATQQPAKDDPAFQFAARRASFISTQCVVCIRKGLQMRRCSHPVDEFHRA